MAHGTHPGEKGVLQTVDEQEMCEVTGECGQSSCGARPSPPVTEVHFSLRFLARFQFRQSKIGRASGRVETDGTQVHMAEVDCKIDSSDPSRAAEGHPRIDDRVLQQRQLKISHGDGPVGDADEVVIHRPAVSSGQRKRKVRAY